MLRQQQNSWSYFVAFGDFCYSFYHPAGYIVVEFEGSIVCTAPGTQIARGYEGMSVSGTLLMRLECFKKIDE